MSRHIPRTVLERLFVNTSQTPNLKGSPAVLMVSMQGQPCRKIHRCPWRGQVETLVDLKDDGTFPSREIPIVKGLPLIGSIPEAKKWKDRTHLLQQKRFKELGPIFRERLGPIEFIYLSDLGAIEKLYQNEGQYPRRLHVPSWTYWREHSDYTDKGLFTESDGPRWRSMRSALEKRLLRPCHVMEQTERLEQVSTDALTRLSHIQHSHGHLQDLAKEMFYWSLESIGSVLYETRFEGLSPDSRDPSMWAFISSVREVFSTTRDLVMVPPAWAKYLMPGAWKRHSQAWSTIFSVGKKIIDERLAEVEEKQAKGKDLHSFLAHMLAESNLSLGQIYANITEMMLAAVETTSNSTTFALYELARHPDIQEELRQQVNAICPAGQNLTYEHLKKIPLASAIIKETLRLYPPTNIQRHTQEDLILCDYHIPRGSIIISHVWSTGRDPDNFDDPEEFQPSRWLDTAYRRRTNPYATLPFSHGKRMCLGRRIAELNMKLLLSKIVQEFHIKPDSYEPLETRFIGIVVPDQPPNLILEERN